MNVKSCFSKFKPDVWRIQSEIVRRRAREINERIEAVIEGSEAQSDLDDDEDNPESREFEQNLN